MKTGRVILSGASWVALRTAVLTRDGWRCVRCRLHGGLDPHHIVPRSQGGGDVLTNLLSLCRKCHRLMDGGGWKAYREAFEGYAREKAADGWSG